MKGTCEVCGNPDRHVGRFRTPTKTWTRVCGSCKVRLTLTPSKVAQLQAEVAMACTALLRKPGQA